MGLEFPTCVGLAAGFDKNALRPHALAALGFGFLELGTVTFHPQGPNPGQTLARLPQDRAIINRLGFPNDGAIAIAERLAYARARATFPVPVGLSIGKSRSVDPHDQGEVLADYAASYRVLAPVSDFIVVNVSSPNTAALRDLLARDRLKHLLKGLLAERDAGRYRPLLVKLSPDMADSDLLAILELVADLRVEGIIATNTTRSREGLRSPQATLSRLSEGGLSGPPLKERAVAIVARARTFLGPRTTIIGVGGIESAEDVARYRNAGADLVQLYTGLVYHGPGLPARLGRETTYQEGAKLADSPSLVMGGARPTLH